MRLRFTFDYALLLVAVAALVYFRSLWATALLMLVVAYFILHSYRLKKREPTPESNEFVIDDQDEWIDTAELDIGLNFRKLPNHFRIDYQFDTHFSKSLYEYRLEGTDVLCRLIEDKHEDVGVPEHHNVRDGVVLESELRKKDAESRFHITKVEDTIANFKKDTEWHKMEPISFHGLKYFIIYKKLPQADARRYLRQELERLKAGEARFFKEAEKYGLERDENSLDRLKVSEGRSTPSDEEFRKLYGTESLGITDVEFSWGKKLAAVLEKLLGD